MKRVALSLVLVAGLATSAMAADMATKAPPAAPAPPPSPWDVAITAALMTDYNFRGITQSAHNPSTQAGFEPRYNSNFDHAMATPASPARASTSRITPRRKSTSTAASGRPSTSSRSISASGTTGTRAAIATARRSLAARVVAAARRLARPFPTKTAWVRRFGQRSQGQRELLRVVRQGHLHGQRSVGCRPPGMVLAVGRQYRRLRLVLGRQRDLTAPSTWFPANSGIGGYISGDLGYWALGTSDVFYGTGVRRLVPGIRRALYELLELGCRLRLDLQGLHARSALLRHQPDQGRLQRLHQRSNSSFATSNVRRKIRMVSAPTGAARPISPSSRSRRTSAA